jgi:hypothetical protein
MADPNEISALKASFRGVLSTSAALQAIHARVDAYDPSADIAAEDLEELFRLAAAHAVASAALRGLVVTMLNRRGAASA